MQKCPKCGYDESVDWHQLIMHLSFCRKRPAETVWTEE
jgi:endogenous inhibitor of DNA gyrase (YacG/DUF329 family)